MIVCLRGRVNSSCLYSEKIEQKRKLRPDLGGNRTDFYSTSMAEQSCSPSEFSAGRSCDSGVVWSSEAQLTSAAAVVTGSLLSVSAHPSACLAVPDNWKIWNESLFLIKSGVHKHGERRRKKKNITRYTMRTILYRNNSWNSNVWEGIELLTNYPTALAGDFQLLNIGPFLFDLHRPKNPLVSMLIAKL